MKGKSIKKFVVIIMAVFFLAITSSATFAQSALRDNDFSILRNVPEAEAVQLNDAEMKDVKGEAVPAILLFVAADIGWMYVSRVLNYMKKDIYLQGKSQGVLKDLYTAIKHVRPDLSETATYSIVSTAAFYTHIIEIAHSN